MGLRWWGGEWNRKGWGSQPSFLTQCDHSSLWDQATKCVCVCVCTRVHTSQALIFNVHEKPTQKEGSCSFKGGKPSKWSLPLSCGLFLFGPGPVNSSRSSDPFLLRQRICGFKLHMKNRSSEEENNKQSLEAYQPNHCLMWDAKLSRQRPRDPIFWTSGEVLLRMK